jgi:hypothetical protein
MARGLRLNPTSDFTTPHEFRAVAADRTRSHHWFDRFVFAPLGAVADAARRASADELPPTDPAQYTLPPAGTRRRIFFAFARAVPNLVERLVEAGGCASTVIVSLQFDDTMNHELRHW